MRRAAYIMATHHRPGMLRLTLLSVFASAVPPGWEMFALVVGADDDPGRAVVESMAREGAHVAYIVERENIIGAKWNQALYGADSDMVLLTGDDDIQSPRRLRDAVAAYEDGFAYSCADCTWFYNRTTRQAAFWESYAGNIGATVNLDARVMRERGGWFELSRNCDNALRSALAKDHIYPVTLPAVGVDTVCTHGDDNVTPRPWPEVGQDVAVGKGRTVITGAPVAALPPHALELLGVTC